MNGLINDLENQKSVVFDTNVLIKHINKLPGFIDIDARFAGGQQFVSIIARMELLAFPALSVTNDSAFVQAMPRAG
jgi:predicted nucleic acid-binding protein